MRRTISDLIAVRWHMSLLKIEFPMIKLKIFKMAMQPPMAEAYRQRKYSDALSIKEVNDETKIHRYIHMVFNHFNDYLNTLLQEI